MPKLPDSTREMLEKGEEPTGGGGRQPVDDGFYLVKPVKVVEQDEKDSGYAGVDVTFQITQPTVQGGRKLGKKKLFDYMSFAPQAAWKFRQLFEAAGYSFDSDLDELVDDEVEIIAEVGHEIQQAGKSKGQIRNTIEAFLAVNDDTEALIMPDTEE